VLNKNFRDVGILRDKLQLESQEFLCLTQKYSVHTYNYHHAFEQSQVIIVVSKQLATVAETLITIIKHLVC